MIEVVGCPASGVADLPGAQLSLLYDAALVVSSPRLLDTLDSLEPAPSAARRAWPEPLLAGLDDLIDSFGASGDRPVVVLATGDPLLSGIGTTLLRRRGPEGVRVHPAVSSVALARARMGWPAETAAWVSVVGRPLGRVTALLTPGARLVVLSSDETTPARLASLLAERGLGAARLTVLGDLGTPSESRHDCTASEYAYAAPRLNVVAVELPPVAAPSDGPFGGPNALLGSVSGRPDDAFHTDGQLTKAEIRAVALSRLRPAPGAVLWDLGAGTGSVAVEWCLRHTSARAYAVERRADRVALIRRNLAETGADLRVLEADIGAALVQLVDLDRPDAIFLGAGVTEPVLDRCLAALRPGGRLVAHAVTLESESVLVQAYRRIRADAGNVTLRRIAVESAEPLGDYLSYRPARAVVQLAVQQDGAP
ncbi:precorrin-6y C5,15-methyltransferase (decarboxylating) subunit CbiE [Flexivirga sp. ID2601S]|uniref:Precorrin-6y C5,15-methyltransferase (Decarboxylating) subunit CbiE n=1 Tax=Flexivirga aerilata TaxID=1656889 RepID=A0A849AJ92_9MICO|nr:precorrin-6y C5,15-methyltransferase (decarboxylating) subunit CbiE [Flexivirga aerilata]